MRRGPIEAHAWPTHLVARVVEPGPSPRIHGYDVEQDLAHHYRFAEVAALSLGGALPSDDEARILDAALVFLAPAEIAEPPAHAARLARTYGAATSAVVGVAAIALAEQARALVAEHAALLAWLGAPDSKFPQAFGARDDASRASVRRFAAAAPAIGALARVLASDPSREAALVSALWTAGLRTAHAIESAIVLARLPAAIAEGLSTKPGAFEAYPMDTPPFAYEDEASP